MVDYKDAKLKLAKVCDDYINYSKQQLDKLVGSSAIVVGDVGNKKPGIKNWFDYHYHLLGNDLFNLGEGGNQYTWRKEISDYDGISRKEYDDPELVLQRFQTVIKNLNEFLSMPSNDSSVEESLKKVLQTSGFRKENFEYNENAPISTKLHLSIQHISSLSDLLFKIANNHNDGDGTMIPIFPRDKGNAKVLSHTASRFCYLRNHINNHFRPEFDGFLKFIAVKELRGALDRSGLNEKEQIKLFETQLNTSSTKEILYRNRQSQTEYYLKILSLISIFVGVGIFTTLGLVFKRLYDTSGHSANFFKPLTVDLSECSNSIIKDIKEESDFDLTN